VTTCPALTAIRRKRDSFMGCDQRESKQHAVISIQGRVRRDAIDHGVNPSGCQAGANGRSRARPVASCGPGRTSLEELLGVCLSASVLRDFPILRCSVLCHFQFPLRPWLLRLPIRVGIPQAILFAVRWMTCRAVCRIVEQIAD
jgi:hypothetical protein